MCWSSWRGVILDVVVVLEGVVVLDWVVVLDVVVVFRGWSSAL